MRKRITLKPTDLCLCSGGLSGLLCIYSGPCCWETLFLTTLWAQHWVGFHCPRYLGASQLSEKLPPHPLHTLDCLPVASSHGLLPFLCLEMVLVVWALICTFSPIQSREASSSIPLLLHTPCSLGLVIEQGAP